MRDKEWIAYILKNGSLPEARLTLLPILKTCDDWKKVLPLGLVDYRTLLAAYEGALVELDGKLYFVRRQTISALKDVRKWNFPRVVKIEPKSAP